MWMEICIMQCVFDYKHVAKREKKNHYDIYLLLVEFLQSLVNEPSSLTFIIQAEVREKEKHFKRKMKYRSVEFQKCQ